MQLRELDALSDEAQREAMQRLIDEVSRCQGPLLTSLFDSGGITS
jgi:hypothetical protein